MAYNPDGKAPDLKPFLEVIATAGGEGGQEGPPAEYCRE
jgi:hypothetical protein